MIGNTQLIYVLYVQLNLYVKTMLTWYLTEVLPMLKTVSSHGIGVTIMNLVDTFFHACSML